MSTPNVPDLIPTSLEQMLMSHEKSRPLDGPILLIDDNHDVVDALTMLLQSAGHDVLSAYSAREALDRLDEHDDVAVVISDVRMPEVDGLDFLRVVRHRFPGMRVILMTGHTITDEDIVPVGATILTKPVEFDALAMLLAQPAQ